MTGIFQVGLSPAGLQTVNCKGSWMLWLLRSFSHLTPLEVLGTTIGISFDKVSVHSTLEIISRPWAGFRKKKKRSWRDFNYISTSDKTVLLPKINVTDVYILLKNESCPFHIENNAHFYCQSEFPLMPANKKVLSFWATNYLFLSYNLCKRDVSVIVQKRRADAWGIYIFYVQEGRNRLCSGIWVWITNYNFIGNGRVDAVKKWRGKCHELFENSCTSY